MSSEQQYSSGFEEWWAESVLPDDASDRSKRDFHLQCSVAWAASALRMERIKDAAYSMLRITRDRQLQKLTMELAVRKDVHRDDYKRAGILIAGLKNIQLLGGAAEVMATETLQEALRGWRDE